MTTRSDPSPEVMEAQYANLKNQYKKILELYETASIVMARQEEEDILRNEYPTLMEAWEEYQVKLKLISAGQLTR